MVYLVPSIGFHGFKKKYKVSIRQYTGYKSYWVGTKIIFSGKYAAYLSKQGKQILKSRQKDFDLLYLFKEDNSYIFSSQLDYNKHIRREQITEDINKIMGLVSKNLPDQPNLKSHSFRTSFITQLWKDTNDIEFVRQVIGHSKLDTTSSYVQYLSEKERQERISEIWKLLRNKNLIIILFCVFLFNCIEVIS